MSLDNLFHDLYQSKEGARIALDQKGKATTPYLAIVTDNNDPLNKRRIKVSNPICPGIDSDWIRRLADQPFVDAPLPPVGSTVMVYSAEGDSLNGWYKSCINDTNPPLDKQDIVNDYAAELPGNRTVTVDGNDSLNATGDITISNDAEVQLEMNQNGILTISLPATGSYVIKLGGVQVMSVDGSNINFTTPSLTWNGITLAKVGGKDTSGDTTLS